LSPEETGVTSFPRLARYRATASEFATSLAKLCVVDWLPLTFA